MVRRKIEWSAEILLQFSDSFLQNCFGFTPVWRRLAGLCH
jgi:hypothetical protein